MVRLLLQHGANVMAQDINGITLLHLAVSNEQEEVVRILLEAGADAGTKDSTGTTPLSDAEERGLTSITDILRRTRLSETGN